MEQTLLHNKPRTENTSIKPGLICLKGGDLAKEIQESGTRPHMIEIKDLFPEDSFKEKYLLYVPGKNYHFVVLLVLF